MLVFAVLFGYIASTANSQVSFQENWSGSTINASSWTVSLPFPDSAYSVNNGSITLSNRATLLSTESFYSPIEITGTLSVGGSDAFRFLTRTSGEVQQGNIFNELTGLWFSFYGVGDVSPGILISYVSETSSQDIANVAFTFDPAEFYTYLIRDDGTNASVWVDGVEALSVATDPLFTEGNQIALYNRQTLFVGGPQESTLGPLLVTAVPEPSTVTLVSLSGLFCLVSLFCKRIFATRIKKSSNL